MSNATQERAFRMAMKAARQGVGFTVQDLADELGQLAALEGEVDPGDVPDADTLDGWESGKGAPREWERPTVELVERILGVEGQLTDALGW